MASRDTVNEADTSTSIALRLRSRKGKEYQQQQEEGNAMEKLGTFLKESCQLSDEGCEEAIKILETDNMVRSTMQLASFLILCGANVSEAKAFGLARTARGIFDSRKPTSGSESVCLSVSSGISKQLSRVMSSTSPGPPSLAAQEPAVYYQDRGKVALASPVDDADFPVQASAKVTEYLWPLRSWTKDLSRKKQLNGKLVNVSAEEAFQSQLDKQVKLSMPKYVNSVFIKATGHLCAPKLPDFYLVKWCAPTPTPETVGAILFTQFTSKSRNYTEDAAVGEAIAVGQKFLSNCSKQRSFIIVGVTNLQAIMWFKVSRSDSGTSHYSRKTETANVRESMAGFMCSPFETIGIHSGLIKVGKTYYSLGRWLGEGHTSHVYILHVKSEEFSVKVPKVGKDVSTDIEYLTKLHGIKGIPVINSAYSKPAAMFMQPVCLKFTRELIFNEKIQECLGELVDTLKSAHDRLVVNRDVRLQNIMIANGNFFIVDWGYAAPLSEPVCYSGTTYFASERVLRLLEDDKTVFAYEASDDLVSLVQSISLFTRLNPYVQAKLYALQKNDYAEIRRFWEENLGDQPANLLILALKRSYFELKEGIQSWVQQW